MNTEIIHQELQELLETIQEQYEAIRTSQERIPRIEFDILKDNLRKFYDKIHLLQHPSDPYEKTAKPKGQATPEPSSRSGIKSVERPRGAVKKEQETEKKTTVAADGDLFAGEEPVFNIKLREAREKSLPHRPEPVTHLKNLISINDKFLFINELFDGNLKEYNDAIETINGFDNRNDALGHLDLLRRKNVWALGSGTFMKLKEMVEKYFA